MNRRPMVQMQGRVKKAEQALRTRGYDDGYAGRVAVSVNAHYQSAWRRGREAAFRDQTEA